MYYLSAFLIFIIVLSVLLILFTQGNKDEGYSSCNSFDWFGDYDEDTQSFIYLLRNDLSFKDGNILKILRTNDYDDAIKKYNSGVPYPYYVVFKLECSNSKLLEKDLKTYLKDYALEGVNSNKKYYSISSELLSDLLDTLSDSVHYDLNIERGVVCEYKE